MPPLRDLCNARFGAVTVIGRCGYLGKNIQWLCRCDCGGERRLTSEELSRMQRYGVCTCGRRKEHHGEGGRKKRYSVEYKAWERMKRRCYYPKDEFYNRYGGRGIKVCDEWKNSFRAFLRDMGRKPSSKHTLDRINNDKNYIPGNCRWATQQEQQRNQSRNRRIAFHGQVHCITEWAELLGLTPLCISSRLNRGWTEQETLSIPFLGKGNWKKRLEQ